jgi:hypothetical protein
MLQPNPYQPVSGVPGDGLRRTGVWTWIDWMSRSVSG